MICAIVTVSIQGDSMTSQKSEDVKSEVRFWNGRTYRRYPNSKQSSHRRYFSRSGGFLHRDVWAYFNGPIPDGCHIHHKDNDPSNNDISNLECLPKDEHFKEHSADRSARAKTPKQIALLNEIRPKTKEWHRSEEGRAWHRENAKSSLEKARKAVRFSNKPDLHRECDVCGGPIVTRNIRKFTCSVACQSRKSKAKKRAAIASMLNSVNNKDNPV